MLERGAVEGEVFHRGAVQALAPGEPQVTPRLAALTRKQLIHPDKSQLAGEDGFRFRHLLIRDAAYDALPKAVRADLHARLADWLDDRGRDLVELDEIVGYHLEQAARYKAELGQPDSALSLRAGKRLATAGRRALWRDDDRAAARLLARALELTRPLRLDVNLELDLAQALGADPQQAAAVAELAADRAAAADDAAGEALARAVAAYYQGHLTSNPHELEALALTALPLLEQAGDHAGLVHLWTVFGFVANMRSRSDDWVRAGEEALRHARLDGQPSPSSGPGLGAALATGPRPADEALATLERLDVRSLWSSLYRAWLLAMLGRFDEASPLAKESYARFREQSRARWGDWIMAEIATLAEDHETASRHLTEVCEWLQESGQLGFLSSYAPDLGRSLCSLGRYEEAEEAARLGRELGDEQDIWTQALWRQVQARVLAHRGLHAEAERLAREAVEVAERSDGLNWQADAHFDLAEVLAAAGRTDEAAEAFEQAFDRYERKKNLAMAAQVRSRLESLRAELPL